MAEVDYKTSVVEYLLKSKPLSLACGLGGGILAVVWLRSNIVGILYFLVLGFLVGTYVHNLGSGIKEAVLSRRVSTLFVALFPVGKILEGAQRFKKFMDDTSRKAPGGVLITHKNGPVYILIALVLLSQAYILPLATIDYFWPAVAAAYYEMTRDIVVLIAKIFPTITYTADDLALGGVWQRVEFVAHCQAFVFLLLVLGVVFGVLDVNKVSTETMNDTKALYEVVGKVKIQNKGCRWLVAPIIGIILCVLFALLIYFLPLPVSLPGNEHRLWLFVVSEGGGVLGAAAVCYLFMFYYLTLTFVQGVYVLSLGIRQCWGTK